MKDLILLTIKKQTNLDDESKQLLVEVDDIDKVLERSTCGRISELYLIRTGASKPFYIKESPKEVLSLINDIKIKQQ